MTPPRFELTLELIEIDLSVEMSLPWRPRELPLLTGTRNFCSRILCDAPSLRPDGKAKRTFVLPIEHIDERVARAR